ncbi:hypothetical protein [Pseudomonas karstica]|uniref:hypothetical protein n=1 Tax=Pseudomonas karstica TaxID=1055468 RepID=UPI003608BE17
MDINQWVVSLLKNNHGFNSPVWTVENAEKYSAPSADLSLHRSHGVFAGNPPIFSIHQK